MVGQLHLACKVSGHCVCPEHAAALRYWGGQHPLCMALARELLWKGEQQSSVLLSLILK